MFFFWLLQSPDKYLNRGDKIDFYRMAEGSTIAKMFWLPMDVLERIKEYASPIMTRLDWRTCKRKESRRIKMSNRALCLWYKWIMGPGIHPLYEEIKGWTFYGRRHLIQESRKRYWTRIKIKTCLEDDPEWYEQRYIRYGMNDYILHSTTSIESHMCGVSLIV